VLFGGGASEAAPAVDLKVLHAKIGELTLENDLYEGLMSSRPYVSFGDEGPFPSSRCLSGVRCVAFGWSRPRPFRRWLSASPDRPRTRHNSDPDRAQFHPLTRSILRGAVVRLAHQLISGSSVTARHNPSCTTQTIEKTGSHFLPA
jgi:hypothetical protein